MPRGHLPVRSYLAVPVKSRSGEVIGGLFFGHPEPDVFTERAERLVVGMAAQAAVAIDNARLYEPRRRPPRSASGLLESERAARSAAERLSEMKDEFLATLSHELRTPLNAILGWAQVLRRGPKTEADLAKGLETIERNARVQAQLIEDLLDMSRITSGKMRLDIQPHRARRASSRRRSKRVKPAAEAKRRLARRHFSIRGAGPISGDPNRLQQVVWNLLSNAIKFTPRERQGPDPARARELPRRDQRRGHRHRHQAGIPAARVRALPAGRRSTTSRNYGGLGLGLSIVKQLVELHGGTVHVASPGEGQGTTFAVRLPLTVVHRAGRRSRPSGARRGRTRPPPLISPRTSPASRFSWSTTRKTRAS